MIGDKIKYQITNVSINKAYDLFVETLVSLATNLLLVVLFGLLNITMVIANSPSISVCAAAVLNITISLWGYVELKNDLENSIVAYGAALIIPLALFPDLLWSEGMIFLGAYLVKLVDILLSDKPHNDNAPL